MGKVWLDSNDKYTQGELENCVDDHGNNVKDIWSKIKMIAASTPKDIFPEDTLESLNRELDNLWEDLTDELYDKWRYDAILNEYLYGDGTLKKEYDDIIEERKQLQEAAKKKLNDMRILGLNSFNFNDISIYDRMKTCYADHLEELVNNKQKMTEELKSMMLKEINDEYTALMQNIKERLKD